MKGERKLKKCDFCFFGVRKKIGRDHNFLFQMQLHFINHKNWVVLHLQNSKEHTVWKLSKKSHFIKRSKDFFSFCGVVSWAQKSVWSFVFRYPCSLRSQTLFKCLLCLYEVEYREDKDLVCKPLTLLCHKPGAAPRFATLLTYILWDKKELTGSWSRPSLRLEANWHFPWIIANQTSLLSLI